MTGGEIMVGPSEKDCPLCSRPLQHVVANGMVLEEFFHFSLTLKT